MKNKIYIIKKYFKEQKMIKFERIYNYNGNDYKILIDRMWPRGIAKNKIDLWMKEIAPTREIVLEYHKTNDYNKFKQAYFKELEEKDKEVNKLLNTIKSKSCVLVYSSKNEMNNATVLKEYLTQVKHNK